MKLSEQLRAGTFPARLFSPAEVRAFAPSLDGRVKPVDLTDTFNFACAQCGYCCYDRDPVSNLLTGHDVARLAEGLGVPTRAILMELAEFTVRPGWFGFKLRAEETCPLWDRETRRCLAHHCKPLVCRLAPLGCLVFPEHRAFALMHVKNRAEWCPGLRRGPQYSVAAWLDQIPAGNLAALIVEAILLHGIVDVYRQHYPGPREQVTVAGGMISMLEDLLYDTSNFLESLTLSAEEFNRLLAMPLTERYWVGVKVINTTLAKLCDLHARGEPFPEYLRPNGCRF